MSSVSSVIVDDKVDVSIPQSTTPVLGKGHKALLLFLFCFAE
jgi:hypothetical protein